ncbi:MAG: sigma factor [Umezawaea sp.]
MDRSDFERHRTPLFAAAYRMLGTRSDAEDVLQEAWLRWSRVDHDAVEDPRAYLFRSVTRLALDHLRRVKARREAYVGPWLPEPLITSRTWSKTSNWPSRCPWDCSSCWRL